jgi:hypothetical protein
VVDIHDQVALRSHHVKYVCAVDDHRAVANRDRVGLWEQWQALSALSGSLV